MFRTLLAASIFFFVANALVACSSDSNQHPSVTISPPGTGEPTAAIRVSPESKPTNVPSAATPVEQTSKLGQITRSAEETPKTDALRTLTEGLCANDVLIIHTSQETIYASLTCDKFDNDQFAQLFAGKQAALVLEVGPDRYRILIETIDGAQAQFTPDAIWVE